MGRGRGRRVARKLKLQITGGQANPAPPVGPALGQAQVNIGEFVRQFNDATRDNMGQIIPVEITVYEDRSFTFITKTPPAAFLLKQAAGLDKGSGEPNRDEGRHGEPGPGRGDSTHEDARPQRRRHRRRVEDRRGHGQEHGDNGRWVESCLNRSRG